MSRKFTFRRMLHRKATKATLRRVSGGTFDPVTSAVTGQTTSEVDFKGKVEKYTAIEVNGAEIQQNDLKMTAPALDFENDFPPQDGDTVIFTDTDQKFNVRKVRPMDFDVAYELQLRA